MTVGLQNVLKDRLAAIEQALGGSLPLDPAVRRGAFSSFLHRLGQSFALVGPLGPEVSATRLQLTRKHTALPAGSTVKTVCSHGLSAWSYTLKIETVKPDGEPESFFAKVGTSEPISFACQKVASF